MSSQENQFLPNDQTVQIDYKPNPRMLDHRGEWTASLMEAFDLHDWQITENQILVLAKSEAQIVVNFKTCTSTYIDLASRDDFPRKATKLLNTVFALPGFGDPVSVNRIGVLSRFCTSFDKGFPVLAKQFRERYVDFRADGQKSVNSPNDDAELVDLGAPLNFKDVRGEFNTLCGPMGREQIKRQFLQYREEKDLPEVGLYFQIDYFVRPEKEMSSAEVIAKVADFCYESWDRHQRIRKLIVGA